MFDELNDDNWAHSSVQRAEQEAMKKARRGFANRDKNHPDDQAILNYKLRLDKLQRERQYKNAALAARNVLLIKRDEEAREEYARTHKSEEEIYRDEMERREREHRDERFAFEAEEEAPVRHAIEEEWELERRCLDYSWGLSFFTLTVERDWTRHRREERQRAEALARLQSSSEALARQQKLLTESWQEGVATIEREERATRRNVAGRAPEARRLAERAHAARMDFEQVEAARLRVEAAARHEREQDEAVGAEEAEFQKRMQKLAAKYSSSNVASAANAATTR
jgi:hypothetical protein